MVASATITSLTSKWEVNGFIFALMPHVALAPRAFVSPYFLNVRNCPAEPEFRLDPNADWAITAAGRRSRNVLLSEREATLVDELRCFQS